ncbi:hypothetical protein [Streptomyces lunalinharesii]|uniref:hypothetical protein n=1 Tax=Streptomyces lunalinharesii TaxID=333384 RepID=UPI0031D32AB3
MKADVVVCVTASARSHHRDARSANSEVRCRYRRKPSLIEDTARKKVPAERGRKSSGISAGLRNFDVEPAGNESKRDCRTANTHAEPTTWAQYQPAHQRRDFPINAFPDRDVM